ncbi:hypothetical protein GCM10023191_003870 [Actinoallomurus oryzae]|uniref:Uncharacterized protein n=1 Tax=Actinoallomurus oryzae TaxID=502180 RepID=A0ABP8P860_9ACTN
MTRGRATTPDPFDISAVSSSDELFDALSTRRLADVRRSSSDDPAAALLAALVADVDAGAPPLPAPPSRVPCGLQGQYRRGVRVFVTFGVAAMVLTSAGAAAAGGGKDLGAMGGTHGSAGVNGAERSNENAQRHDPVADTNTMLTGRRMPTRRPPDKRPRAVPPEDSAPRAADDPRPPWTHWGHRPSRGTTRSPVDGHGHHPSSHTDAHPSNDGWHRSPYRPERTSTP